MPEEMRGGAGSGSRGEVHNTLNSRVHRQVRTFCYTLSLLMRATCLRKWRAKVARIVTSGSRLCECDVVGTISRFGRREQTRPRWAWRRMSADGGCVWSYTATSSINPTNGRPGRTPPPTCHPGVRRGRRGVCGTRTAVCSSSSGRPRPSLRRDRLRTDSRTKRATRCVQRYGSYSG